MRVLVWDTETTGLTLHPRAAIDKQPRIIEFGGAIIDTDKREVVQTSSILIDPETELDEEITRITGLRDADLVGAPSFRAALPQIRPLFAESDLMIAHNLPFDESLLRYELDRIRCTDFVWPRAALCSVQVYAEDVGRRLRLIELYERVIGKPLAQTHRALDDVMALAEIVIKEEMWTLICHS